jgi:hypothetical protein
LEEITKKGQIAEHIAMADLIRKNFIPCSPTINTSSFDIVGVRGKDTVKVQVKGFTFGEEDKYKLTIKRPSSREYRYTPEDYDILALVETDEQKVAYFPFVDQVKITMHRERPTNLRGFQLRNTIYVFYDYLDIEQAIEKWKELSA